MKNIYLYLNATAILLPLLFCSCVNTKKAIYLDNIGDAEISRTIDNLEPVIQKNDLLSITVSSPNPAATQFFNPPSATPTQASGYLVNQDGYIEFPLLGNMKAAGFTKKQLKEIITKAIIQKQLLLEPVVAVRYLNYKVTVLGEVAHPAVINVPDEKMSLLEALGMAGDMTIYARRDNVMVIREEEGKRIIKRLDLNSKELFTSPYYYLKSNDIVYVEPNRAKIATASRSNQWLPILMSGLSLGVIIIDRLTR
ncbi:MAG: polysaccharide biosynthesis/export family protein [Flavisolibacter sp.]|nr:polysaccharide biosynthesis/export family protein [Flavisolibacter sp.]